MRRLVLLVAVLASGCFHPDYPKDYQCGPSAECPPGQSCDRILGVCHSPSEIDGSLGEPDAPVIPDAMPAADGPDATPADAGPDAGLPDAAVPDGSTGADAGPVDCPITGGMALPLPFDTDVSGNTSSGTSVYTPSCTVPPDAPEVIYVVDVPAGGRAVDLLVDVTAADNIIDPVVSITRSCADVTTEVACTNAENDPSFDEVAVVPKASGRYFIVVDGSVGTVGAFTIHASLRPILDVGQTCDFSLQRSRCGDDLYCDGDTCRALPIVPESRVTSTSCDVANGPIGRSAAFVGTTAPVQTDMVALAFPTVPTRLRVAAYTAHGSCQARFYIGVQTGTCPSTAEITEDQGSGLGPCGLIDLTVDPASPPTNLYVTTESGPSQQVPYTIVVSAQ